MLEHKTREESERYEAWLRAHDFKPFAPPPLPERPERVTIDIHGNRTES